MMYVIVILIGVLLLLYFGGRWLAHEAREAGKALHNALLLVTGGQTPDRLIREAHQAFAQRGLGPPDLVAVPSEADKVYEALREHALERAPDPPLAGALGTVLAVNVDHRMAYLRAVDATPGQHGGERTELVPFSEITAIRPALLEPHPCVASAAENALELEAGPERPTYRLPVDPAWGVSADDLTAHLETMVRDRRRPAGGTVILR